MPQPITLSSFRGGLNQFDPPTALPNDQVTEATNVEFVGASLGSRRKGHSALTLPAFLTAYTAVYKMHRHLPSSDESESELWVLAGTPGVGATLGYKSGSTWTEVSLIDTPATTEAALTQVRFQTLHGKLFIAYDSAVDRLHVWDGTSLRRAGLGTPAAAPTGANSGVGTFSGTRYYRIRYTVQSGGTTIRRSEPSAVLTHAPSGSGTGVTVTKPATISESETHWELEASLNNADFYRIATTAVGTATATDTTAFATGYAAAGTLSEDAGDYTVIPSVKFLAADQDRLLVGGSFEDEELASRVQWTPVQLDLGVGNDERLQSDVDPFLDLDGFEGGEMTGLINNGTVYASKWSHTYRIVRTNQLQPAYNAIPVSKTTGAVPGSVVAGNDPAGNPAVFALDLRLGPIMMGVGGQIQVGQDIRPIWEGRTTSTAVNILARGVYYPNTRQVRYAYTEAGQTGTSSGLTLHVNEMQVTREGGRRGWVEFDGDAYTNVTDMILYADNVESGSARSTNLKPLVSRSGDADSHHILLADDGTTDDGVAFAASIVSKPLLLGGGSTQFGVTEGTLVATAAANTTVDVTLIRDFGKESNPVEDVSLAPEGSETHVIVDRDDLVMSESKAIQVKVADSDPSLGQWAAHQIVLSLRTEQQTK